MKIAPRRRLLYLLLLLLMGPPLLGQTVGTTSFQFLKVLPDARAAAMGEAVSTAVNTSSALFYNPGALIGVDKFDVSFAYVDWFLDVSISSVAAAYTIPALGTIGILGILHDYGSIEETTVDQLGFREDGTYNPGLTGNSISPSSMVLGVSLARALTNKFSLGLMAKYVSEDLVHAKASAVIFDGGLLYYTGFRSLTLAATLRNLGQNVTFVDEDYPIPQTFALGVSGYLASSKNSMFIASDKSRLLYTFELIHPRDYDQQYKMGLEYSFSDMLFLRAGYKINYDVEGLSLGAGIRLRNLRFDYAFSDFGAYLSPVQRVTLGFSID